MADALIELLVQFKRLKLLHGTMVQSQYGLGLSGAPAMFQTGSVDELEQVLFLLSPGSLAADSPPVFAASKRSCLWSLTQHKQQLAHAMTAEHTAISPSACQLPVQSRWANWAADAWLTMCPNCQVHLV